MKRLNGYTGKNHFYRANRELGRIFKTEYILHYLSDKTMRQRVRRGLLKGEEIHALARDLNYGKRGQIKSADLHEQKMSCSCMTLILACIIYWQAKEINRVVLECDQEKHEIDLSLIEHISPISWITSFYTGNTCLIGTLFGREKVLSVHLHTNVRNTLFFVIICFNPPITLPTLPFKIECNRS